MPIWSQYKRRDHRSVPSTGPFPAGPSFPSQDSSREINLTMELKNWSCFQTLLCAYLHFRFLFTGIYYVADLWFGIQILTNRWQGRMHRSSKINRINAQLPICLRGWYTFMTSEQKDVFNRQLQCCAGLLAIFCLVLKSLTSSAYFDQLNYNIFHPLSSIPR